ncbi:MAG: sulfurtransferase [Betaproteobacteria bacterium]|nr:sulfurtransferase [Betaproteobacteria bacterium]
MKQITPRQLSEWLADPGRPSPVLLDVRELWEFQTCSLGDSRHIPMNEVPSRVPELDKTAETVVICHHGGRSQQIAMHLSQSGFSGIFNLQGGLDAWARQVDTSMPVY